MQIWWKEEVCVEYSALIKNNRYTSSDNNDWQLVPGRNQEGAAERQAMVRTLSIYSRTTNYFGTDAPDNHLGYKKRINNKKYLQVQIHHQSHGQSFRFHNIGNGKPNEKTDSKIRGKGDSQNQQRHKQILPLFHVDNSQGELTPRKNKQNT